MLVHRDQSDRLEFRAVSDPTVHLDLAATQDLVEQRVSELLDCRVFRVHRDHAAQEASPEPADRRDAMDRPETVARQDHRVE